MRTEFDGAAFDRWLEREGESDEAEGCPTCDGSGWLGTDHCPDCGDVWGYGVEEESADEAKARMTADEKAADAAWEQSR